MIELPATARERAVAGVLVGGAVLFVGLGAPRVAKAGLVDALTLPLVLLAADLLIALALLTWWYPVRPVSQGLAVFGFLVHLLVALRGGPMWTRGCSAVLAAAHVGALVLLFLVAAAEEADPGDDTEGGDTASFPGPWRPAAAEVETPVSQVVELAVAEPDVAESESDETSGAAARHQEEIRP